MSEPRDLMAALEQSIERARTRRLVSRSRYAAEVRECVLGNDCDDTLCDHRATSEDGEQP